MRSDVLDLMAEEINARPVGKLASFLAFDGSGRAKLDGMARGSRWDIDREQREFSRASKAELARLKCRKFKLAHPEYFREWMRAKRQRDSEAVREKDRAAYERNKAKISAQRLARGRTPEQIAKQKAASRRWYERNRERILAKAKKIP